MRTSREISPNDPAPIPIIIVPITINVVELSVLFVSVPIKINNSPNNVLSANIIEVMANVTLTFVYSYISVGKFSNISASDILVFQVFFGTKIIGWSGGWRV